MLKRADLKLSDIFNSQGMHYDPEKLKDNASYLGDALYRYQVDNDFAAMSAIGITMVIVLNATDYIYKLATKYGMTIINRDFRRADEPFTNDGDLVGTAHRNGHPAIVQLDNEATFAVEYDGRPVNLDVASTILIVASMQVYDQGGIVMWQTLDFDYFRYCVWKAYQMGAERIFQRFMLSLHNYGINHPPTYREDDGGFLGFLWWMQICEQELGFVPLMVSGEWGWGLNESKDNRFPPVSHELRNAYEMEVYDSFRTGHLSDGTPIPNEYLGVCKWIWHARGRTYWEDDAIIKSDGSRREDFIQGMLARPTFVRRFTDEEEPPIPQPEPTPEEEPTMPADSFTYAFGFRDLYDSAPVDVGKAISPQKDVPGLFSIQFTEHGLMLYDPTSNTSKFFRQALPR